MNTAEASLSSMQSQVARLQELYYQAQNGTYSESDKQSMQAEVNQITDNIASELKNTTFNGMGIFGEKRNGIHFDGTQSVTLPYPGFNPFQSPYTIDLWVKSDNKNTNTVYFGSGATDVNTRIYLGQLNGKWTMGVQNKAWAQQHPTIPITENQWTHISMTLEGGTATLFVNGEESMTLTYADYFQGGDYSLGKYQTWTFQGALDDIRIYDRALSKSEVKSNYFGNIVHDSLSAEWKMDGTGDVIPDTSGNGYNADLNDATRIEGKNIPYIHTDYQSKEGAYLPPLELNMVSLGINNLDITDPDSLKVLKGAEQMLIDARTSVGIKTNTFDFKLDRLNGTVTDLETTNMRIEDVNMAEVSSELVKNQIKLQTSMLMMQKNNANRENVISLLQG